MGEGKCCTHGCKSRRRHDAISINSNSVDARFELARERKMGARRYLLSNDIRIVTGFDLESTVLRPKVDRIGNASDTPLIDLATVLAAFTSI
jgi:hypothetical protein